MINGSIGLYGFGSIALGQKPELVFQSGHSSPVESLVPSPDGKLLASVDSTGTIVIWHISSGLQLRSFSVPSAWTGSVAFSPDGRSLAYGYSRGIKLWDVNSGKEFPDFGEGESSNIAFSPDGRSIASVDTEGELAVWNIESKEKKILREAGCYVSGGSGADRLYVYYSLAFNPDGKSIAFFDCLESNNLESVNIETGKALLSFEDRKSDEYVARSFRSLIFSSDGKMLAGTREFSQPFVFLKEGADGRMTKATEEIKPPAVTTTLWNAVTGKIEHSFPGSSPKFSNNGKYLMIRDQDALILRDVASESRLLTVEGQTGAFLPNSTKIAVVNKKAIEIHDLESGEKPKSFSLSSLDSIGSVDISPDGRSIAVSLGAVVKIWNLSSDQNLTSLEEFKDASPVKGIIRNNIVDSRINQYNANPYAATAFSPNNGIIASSYNRFEEYPDEGFDVRSSVVLWSRASGRILNSFVVDTSTLKEFFVPELKSLLFSPNGRIIATQQGNKSVKLIDLYSGRIIEVPPREGFTPKADLINTMVFSPDGKLLAFGDGWGIGLVDTKTGESRYLDEPSEETGPINDEFDFLEGVISLAFSPDGKMIGGAISDRVENERIGTEADVKDFAFWEVSTGKKLGLKRVPAWAKFSYQKSKFLRTGSKRIKVEVFGSHTTLIDSETGLTMLTLTACDDNGWLVTTPDGFFDGVPGAWKRLLWRFNQNLYEHTQVEPYFNDFFYPNLLQDVLAGKSPKAPPGGELEKKDRRQPKVEIASINGLSKDEVGPKTGNPLATDKRDARIVIEVTDNSSERKRPDHDLTSGAHDLRLFRNGSLVRVWHGDVFNADEREGCERIVKSNEPRRVRCQADIPVMTGENNFTAYAFNAANVKSEDDSFSIKGNDVLKRDGTLYVLAIGVNKYLNSAYDLNFAVPDARDIASAIRAQQEKFAQDPQLRQYAQTETITLIDENATRENILFALRRFSAGNAAAIPAGTSDELKTEFSRLKPAQPEDALVIYYAGHGTSKGPRFYLLPHNFTGLGENPLANGVSDEDLGQVLEKVDAGRLIMVIDACQSGQALGGKVEGRGPMNSKGLAQLAYDKGMLILAAAQSQQSALEAALIGNKEIRHGLLTYALLNGLTDSRADRNRDKKISEREWLDFAVERVPQLQFEAMKQRRLAIEKTGRGIELVFVNGDNKNLDPAKRRVQTPRVFYRRETESRPMVLAVTE